MTSFTSNTNHNLIICSKSRSQYEFQLFPLSKWVLSLQFDTKSNNFSFIFIKDAINVSIITRRNLYFHTYFVYCCWCICMCRNENESCLLTEANYKLYLNKTIYRLDDGDYNAIFITIQRGFQIGSKTKKKI